VGGGGWWWVGVGAKRLPVMAVFSEKGLLKSNVLRGFTSKNSSGNLFKDFQSSTAGKSGPGGLLAWAHRCYDLKTP